MRDEAARLTEENRRLLELLRRTDDAKLALYKDPDTHEYMCMCHDDFECYFCQLREVLL